MPRLQNLEPYFAAACSVITPQLTRALELPNGCDMQSSVLRVTTTGKTGRCCSCRQRADRVDRQSRGTDTVAVGGDVVHRARVAQDVATRVAVRVTVGVEVAPGARAVAGAVWHRVDMKTRLRKRFEA